MNLLYTLTTYPPSTGGAQILAHMLAQRLAALGDQVQVAAFWDRNRTDWLTGTTLRADPADRDYVVDGIPVRIIGFSAREKLALAPWFALYYPWMSRALPPIARAAARHIRPLAAQADLIHNVRIGREGLTAASLQLARERGIPFVLTPVHHPRWKGWRYVQYDKLYRAADLLVALTEAEKRILVEKGVREERIVVSGMGPIVREPADPTGFRARSAVFGPMVLFLGQHYAYKGFRQVLEAAPKVWQRFPDAQFVFIGPAVEDSEKAFEGADRRIHRLGPVDLQTKSDALAACDLLCVPSSQESFGGVYVEAWHFGKPVIGARIPAVSEVIDDGQDGFLVEQEAGDIAGRIIDLLADPNAARAMGAAGREKARLRYGWDALAAHLRAEYATLLAGG